MVILDLKKIIDLAYLGSAYCLFVQFSSITFDFDGSVQDHWKVEPSMQLTMHSAVLTPLSN